MKVLLKCALGLFSLFVLHALFVSCASSKTASATPPEWFSNYRTIYPNSKYLAQRGRADTEETARTDAVAQIARYFQTNVNASLKTSVQSVTNGDNVSESTSVINDVEAASQVELFAVEYTDPFYFAAENKWYCVAYIEREKAWTQYKPSVENAKTEFYAMKKNAENETDPYSKVTAYKKALKSGNDFLKKLEYARILDSQKESAYSEDRRTVSEIPSKISSEQEKCSVYLSVSGDYANIISSSLIKALSKNGFRIAQTQNEAAYTAKVFVEDNAIGSEPIAVYPGIDLKITSRDGKTVFAKQAKVEQKTLSYTLEGAQKKSYPILAKEIENTFFITEEKK